MNIVKKFKEFQYENISLTNPVRMQGGSYYSKITIDDAQNFYVQTPKCSTKNGIVETGKRIYTDIILTPEHSDFIQFILDVETRIKKVLQEKNNLWFENSMDDDDIEYFFNTSLKTYRQQNYQFRTYIVSNQTLTSLHNIQIYDNTERELTFNDVKDKNIITIIQFKGIKFTNSSFHIDIELKQIMVLNDAALFSNCLISTSDTAKVESSTEPSTTESSTTEPSNNPGIHPTKQPCNIKVDATNTVNSLDLEKTLDNSKTEEEDIYSLLTTETNNETDSEGEDEGEDESEGEPTISPIAQKEVEGDTQDNTPDIQKQPILDVSTNETSNLIYEEREMKKNNMDCLEEINVSIDDNEPITLKRPNEVYYEMYKRAKKRAKEIKKSAVIAYLEAKEIKKTYMLQDLDDSSSDEDEDYDDLSEMSFEDLESSQS